MDHLNDLPNRHHCHAIEGKAEAAFQNLLSSSGCFILQASDRKDYGTDCQIEVINHSNATNIRIHVQLKGTEKIANTDGSVSIEVRRANLNYLLMQPYSVFVCFHVPTNMLLFCSADAVVQRYEHRGQNWFQQNTLTVNFSELLTEECLKSLANLAKSNAESVRNKRVVQTTARSEDLAKIIISVPPELHVPNDVARAARMLSDLYDKGADEIISAAFEKFVAVLSRAHHAMIFCYMAEINLAMAGRSGNSDRIEDGILYLTSELDNFRQHPGGLYYSIGNGYSALGREEEAIRAYETALTYLTDAQDQSLWSMCYKNLGSSYEKLGDVKKAIKFFRTALYLCPQLPEAHAALGWHCLNEGEYQEALKHFDQVFFADRSLGKLSYVSGWRINALFNLNEGKAAFREISMLLSDAGNEEWIWPWCARQVASFGRVSVDNARLSISFWDQYLRKHPHCGSGVRERLLNILYLRSEDPNSRMSYFTFKEEFEKCVQYVQDESIPYLWDRLGHWAQDNDDWEEAKQCFQVAYDLAGGHYGYCLGTALNFLERPQESLPILLSQAMEIQPDDKSWFQVAVAYEKLGRVREAINAYEKVIELNPDCGVAWFNMGGTHWNAGEREEAERVWRLALKMFPEHELAVRLRHDFPFFIR